MGKIAKKLKRVISAFAKFVKALGIFGEKNSYESSNENLIDMQKSILFSDCEFCWQTKRKDNESVDKSCFYCESLKVNQFEQELNNKLPNITKISRLLKRVLFWREEFMEKKEGAVMKQKIMDSRRSENKKSENKISFVERIKNVLQDKSKYALAISVLLLTFFQVNVYATSISGDKVVTYDANGGVFNTGDSTNVVKYNIKKENITKISKTANVSDDGLTADTTTGYGNLQEKTDVITIPGAEQLEVTISYQTEGTNYDWVCLYDKTITPSSSNYSSSIPKEKLGGKTLTKKTYIIPGDTVQIYFKSDSSICNYFGYYAEISRVGSNVELINGNYKEPRKNNYSLLGWSTNSLAEEVEYKLGVGDIPEEEESTLYAVWQELSVEKYLITEWTIPVDVNGENLGTTIKLPIPSDSSNNFIVDWGDGNKQIFDNTANFPEHTYKNTIKTTYTVKIIGTLNKFGYNNSITPTTTNIYKDYYTFTQYLTGLKQWGELGITQYGFANCANLSDTIPERTENSFKNATSFEYLFYKCTKLSGSIPSGLFSNCNKVTTFQRTFYYCSGLSGSIPETLFANCTEVTSFSYTFSKCSGLSGGIPETLFASCSKVTNFDSTFYYCRGLTGNIPSELFSNCNKVTTFASTFYMCSSLSGNIPEGLFAGCTEVTSFRRIFYTCGGLSGNISEKLFASCSKVTNFNSTFSFCSGLTGNIPENLFNNCPNATNFEETFRSCSGLTGNIPENLFSNCPNVTSFCRTFNFCDGLTGNIPKNLFVNNIGITSNTSDSSGYAETFAYCYGITSAEVDTRFIGYRMFYNCRSLTEITISDKIEEISSGAFYSSEINSTTLNTINSIALNYNWVADNRMINEKYDIDDIDNTSLVMLWTIPVDADGIAGEGTTIELPISLSSNNDFTVNWGDGTESTYTTQDFPTHTYANSEEKKYIIKIMGRVNKFGYDSDHKITSINNGYYTFTQYLTKLISWGELNINKYGFSYCTNLSGEIPEPTEKSFINVTDFDYTFNNCHRLTGNIPAELFSNCSNVTSFNNTFHGCRSLIGNIPSELFSNCPNVTSFKSTFDWCLGLSGNIPENLFSNCPNVTSFDNTFSTCSGLSGNIPENLFSNCPNVTTFRNTFSECRGLSGGIPETLFASCTEVTSFFSTFYECSGLSGNIPENLFSNCSKVTNLNFTFLHCTGLTGNIPAELFSNCGNVTSFEYIFAGCSGLTGNIPEELFSKCSNVTSFEATFSGCVGLIGNIPAELFSNCPNVTSFNSTFYGCSGLSGNIPENLFSNCSNVTNFESTFYDCLGLSGNIPEGLFSNNTGITTNTSTSGGYVRTFYGCKGITSVELDTRFVGREMFYGCNNLTEITISNKLEGIYGTNGAFYYSNSSTPLLTKLNTTNLVALNYNWTADNRILDINYNTDFSILTAQYTYDGTEKQPEISDVVRNGITLVKGTDYEILYGDNTAAGTAKVIVQGIGNYGGTVEKTFTINPKSITIKANEQTMTYGNELESDASVLTAVTLLDGHTIDWIVLASNDKNVGTWTITPSFATIVSDNTDVTSNYNISYQTGTVTINPRELIITPDSNQSKDWGKDDSTLTYTYAGNVWNETPGFTGALSREVGEEEGLYAITLGDLDIVDNGTFLENNYNLALNPTTVNFEITIDWDKALVTEWTIPVDVDKKLATTGIPSTTIKLPIPAHANNNYTVDWGDGSEVETFDSTADFPTHTYTNTEETLYTIKVTGTVNQFGYVNSDMPTKDIEENYYTFTQYLTRLKAWGEIDATRYGFAQCTNLTGTIVLPTRNSFKDVIDMSMLFYNCRGISGNIPESLFTTAARNTSFENTFYNCENLTGNIPENLFTRNKNITTFKNTFKGCTGLSGMIPANLFRDSLATNYESTFENCSGITAAEMTLDTTIVENMDNMFKGCSNLENIVLGKQFKNITGTDMFKDCLDLKAIIMLYNPESEADIGMIESLDSLGLVEDAIIYVPQKEDAQMYEIVLTNISEDRIEQVVKADNPNPDSVKLNEEYTNIDYKVAGYPSSGEEAQKWKQYGFFIEIEGIPVATDKIGTEWIRYYLKR